MLEEKGAIIEGDTIIMPIYYLDDKHLIVDIAKMRQEFEDTLTIFEEEEF